MMNDLAMGEHGLYVWTAYSLAVVAYVWLVCLPLYRHRRFFQQMHELKHLAQKDAQPEFSQPHTANTDGE